MSGVGPGQRWRHTASGVVGVVVRVEGGVAPACATLEAASDPRRPGSPFLVMPATDETRAHTEPLVLALDRLLSEFALEPGNHL